MLEMMIVQVVAIALSATMILEFLNWFLIYRKPEYQELNNKVKSLTKKLEKLTEDGTSKAAEKRKQTTDRQLKEAQQELGMKRFKSTFIIGIFMLVSISQLNKYFAGNRVAKLPFVPFSLISGITHRGLIGEDMTDCSFIFIYILSGMVFRTVIQKLCGFEGAKQSFMPMMPGK